VSADQLPAAQVAEVLELLAELTGEARVARVAARVERDGATPYVARQAAMANAATTMRTVLVGLLSPNAGGVTVAGLEWAATRLRRELDGL
jgi:hypothetical protein